MRYALIIIGTLMALTSPVQAGAESPAPDTPEWRWIITCTDHDRNNAPIIIQERSVKPIQPNISFRVWDAPTDTWIGYSRMAHRILCRTESRAVYERAHE